MLFLLDLRWRKIKNKEDSSKGIYRKILNLYKLPIHSCYVQFFFLMDFGENIIEYFCQMEALESFMMFSMKHNIKIDDTKKIYGFNSCIMTSVFVFFCFVFFLSFFNTPKPMFNVGEILEVCVSILVRNIQMSISIY